MDTVSFLTGVVASLVAMALWIYGDKKRKGYYKQKVEELEYEKSKIEAISKRPSELYKDAFRNIFYLLFIISLANIIRLFHGVFYDSGVVFQQAFIEGGLWFVVASLALKFKKRIDSTYSKIESINDLDEKINKIKEKC